MAIYAPGVAVVGLQRESDEGLIHGLANGGGLSEDLILKAARSCEQGLVFNKPQRGERLPDRRELGKVRHHEKLELISLLRAIDELLHLRVHH